MKAFRWTDTPPAREGLYWHRYSVDHDPSIVKLVKLPDEPDLTVVYGDLDIDPSAEDATVTWLCMWTGQRGDESHQWAGPIPEPVEP